MSENDGWDIVGEYADTVASMTTDISALRTQLNEARADLENERAMRAGEYDDTHSRIEKLHAELVEARAELAKAEAERDQREAECQRWAKGNADLARIISASEPNSSHATTATKDLSAHCDCLGHPTRCYNHPHDCGCTDAAPAASEPCPECGMGNPAHRLNCTRRAEAGAGQKPSRCSVADMPKASDRTYLCESCGLHVYERWIPDHGRWHDAARPVTASYPWSKCGFCGAIAPDGRHACGDEWTKRAVEQQTYARWNMPLKGCRASNAIKGNHEYSAANGCCQLCGYGPGEHMERAAPSPAQPEGK